MFGFLRSRYFWIILAIVIVSLTVTHQTSSERKDLTIVEEAVRNVYTPLQRGVNVFRGYFRNMDSLFADKKRLIKDIKRLEEELAGFRLENQELREYRYEARKLKEQLDFKDQNLTNMALVPAQVIARNPNTWYNTITIDKGKNQGVACNMPVITPQGLVGRVSSVSTNDAVVLLITDREAAVGAIIQENRIPGIIVGTLNGQHLKLGQIPLYSEATKGDRVVTSRFSELYPAGIMIGTIDEVSEEPEAMNKSATVIPAVDLDQIEEVLVITNYMNPAPGWGPADQENVEDGDSGSENQGGDLPPQE